MLGFWVTFLLTGCLYFDSRWVDEQQEKKRAKARLRPAALETGKARADGTTTAVVRAYGTRAYAAETLRWEAQFSRLLDDANRVLQPAIGVTLVNGGTSLWTPESGDSLPTAAVQDLEREDTGDGAQWVVGFVQSVPKVVTDYHVLGTARHFSKYLVLRGSADAAELEGLRQTVNEDQGAVSLYSERRHHKIVTVFLHELAHTLGAVHRTARDTIMSRVYDPKESGFDDATIALLRITAPRILAGKSEEAVPLLAAYLAKDGDGWVGSERDDWLARLKSITIATAAQATQTPSSPAPPPSGPSRVAQPVAFETLSASDRAVYENAVQTESQGDPRAAWRTALPLFETHPRVVEVQTLRCRLAKLQHFFPGVAEAHCERLEGLVAGGARLGESAPALH